MTIKALYPTVRPTLNLDFAKTKALDPRVTFTRASTATYVGADGLIKTAASDAARFDHNPATRESLGLLVEEARTNLISNSSATGSTNGVIGSGGALPTGWNLNRLQGGITVEVISTGTEANGLAYIDLKFSGTTTDGNWTLLRLGNTFSVTNGTAYSSFIYAKTVAGTVPGILQFNFPGSSGNVELSSITATFAKYSAILTSTVTTTVSPLLLIGFSGSGQVLNYTMRIGGIQLEQGSFPTSYIPTTTATVTRAADVASMTGTNFSSVFDVTGGTMVAEYYKSAPQQGNGNYVWSLGSNTPAFAYNNAGGYLELDFTVALGTVTGTALTGKNKSAFKFQQGSYAASVNSGTVFTSSNASSWTTPTSLLIGAGSNVILSRINSTIARLAYYPVRLSDTQLQALTAT